MPEDELEGLEGRERRIVAAHLSLGRRRVVGHDELRKATKDFDEEGHRRTERGPKMNNKPFDAGLRELVADGVYRRTSGGYRLVSPQEQIAEFVKLLQFAMEGPRRVVEDWVRLFDLLHPQERRVEPSPGSLTSLPGAWWLPWAKEGEGSLGEHNERVQQIAELFRPERAAAWRQMRRDYRVESIGSPSS
jgi:hypothetical protein